MYKIDCRLPMPYFLWQWCGIVNHWVNGFCHDNWMTEACNIWKNLVRPSRFQPRDGPPLIAPYLARGLDDQPQLRQLFLDRQRVALDG
jgi:hypothetical protein